MDREEIIQRVLLLDPDQLRALQQFLDRLEDLPENQIPEKGPDPEVPGA